MLPPLDFSFLLPIFSVIFSSVLLGVTYNWFVLANSRRKVLDEVDEQQKSGNPFAYVFSDLAYFSSEHQRTLPKVSVVMP
ncbi:hypothetical protein PAPYR_4872 [Paratrimastix pyriformis]|uniref:ATP synthase F0 subunit 8 n=1 Tax=Paratrimastix pyriformis TaxID=342808 RepID=A0ABQ8UJC5_9EUKA|nr:hypothetical protein PAPYR_4872 [Paratrimastix pyriformis]